MELLEAPFISTLLGLAATFLSLAVLVQIVQELYKFVSSSKSRAYTIALKDFLGPWANDLVRPAGFPDLRVRGPFQLARIRPLGKILPMRKEELVSALERTAQPWVRRVLDRLKTEVESQSGKAASPSAAWTSLLTQLGEVEQGATGFLKATEIAEFLKTWDHTWSGLAPKAVGRRAKTRSAIIRHQVTRVGTISPPSTMDARQVILAFRQRFLPQVNSAEERFPQFEENFTYAYQRRNMRHSFVFALLIALACNLPFDLLYMKASGLSMEQASALAEQALAMQAQITKDSLGATPTAEAVNQLLATSKSVLEKVQAGKGLGSVTYFVDGKTLAGLWQGGFTTILRYLLGCFVTALLVSFGAPVWNDITSALLRLQKGRSQKGANGDV
jgi:hypothetical protein